MSRIKIRCYFQILRGEQDYHKDGPFIFFMDLRKKLLQIKEKAMETMTAKEQKIMNRNDYVSHSISYRQLYRR